MATTTLGADPDAAPVIWEEENEGRRSYNLQFGPVADMVFYFTGKAPFSQMFTDEDKIMLATGLKRMFQRGETEKDIRHVINRFYLTDGARNAKEPCKLFLSTKTQVMLGADTVYREPKDDAMKFIANGMVRMADDDLPWDESFDSTLLTEFATDPAWLGVVLTYPDVVASLLCYHPSNEVYPYIEAVASQLSYLRDDGPKPTGFKNYMRDVSLPKSLLTRGGKLRTRQDSMAEAVIQARLDTT